MTPRIVRPLIAGPVRAARCIAVITAIGLLAAASASRPLPAQMVTDSITRLYEIDGLRVLHHRNASEIFAIRLYLLGGSRQVTSENAGIEPLWLAASDYGTTSFPGELARSVRARTGSSIGYEATRDWTVFAASGMRAEFDTTWALFASRLMHPTLDSAGISTARMRLLSAARRVGNSPEVRAFALAESLAFAGHPYAVDPEGSAASLAALDADQVRAYIREQLVRSRMLLVVVGDVTREHVDALVNSTLGTLPRGEYVWTLPPLPIVTAAAVAPVYQRLSTDYMIGYFHGPLISSPEYPAFVFSMGILSSFASSQIREQQGLSYAAGVGLVERGVSGAYFSVSTTRPDSVVRIFNRLLEAYEDQLRIPNWSLKQAGDSYRQGYLFRMETSAGHADMLARAQLYDGDYRAAAGRAEVMAAMRSPELRRMVRNHAKNIQYGFVGDTSRMSMKDMTKR